MDDKELYWRALTSAMGFGDARLRKDPRVSVMRDAARTKYLPWIWVHPKHSHRFCGAVWVDPLKEHDAQTIDAAWHEAGRELDRIRRIGRGDK